MHNAASNIRKIQHHYTQCYWGWNVLSQFIVQSKKFLNSHWSRAVQLISDSTPCEYLRGFYGNDAWAQPNGALMNVNKTKWPTEVVLQFAMKTCVRKAKRALENTRTKSVETYANDFWGWFCWIYYKQKLLRPSCTILNNKYSWCFERSQKNFQNVTSTY